MKRRHRNITSKLGLLFIVLILSLATISASYAHWEEELDVKAEMTTIEYGCISGYVWLDDGDGNKEPCEVIGIPDITVTLTETFLNNPPVVNTTDDDGFYNFTGLLPVTYTIQITVTFPYTATTTSIPVTLTTAGEHSTNNNFGLQDTTMMGWWKFDEGSGGATVDSSTNGNDGTITGASWTNDGKVCKALNFDGNSDYVGMGDVIDFERTDTYTLAAWIKTTTTEPGGIIAKMNQLHNYQGYDMILESGSIEAHLIHNWPSNAIKVEASTIVNDGLWHHIVVTYDGFSSASGLKIYIDGSPATTTLVEDSLSGTTITSDELRIGSRVNHIPFDGIIDEVKIYNRALTINEISHIYNAEDS